jgi:hypothetical protein
MSMLVPRGRWGRRFACPHNARPASLNSGQANRLLHRPLAVLLTVVAAGGLSCHRAQPALDPDLTSCIPPHTVILAGLDLDRLRASPLYGDLPPAAVALAGSLHDARYLLLASTGQDLLAAARGSFRQAPAGSTLLAPGLAVVGAPDEVRAATEQHRKGTPGAPDLLAQAESLAPGHEIWLAIRGGITLPFTGNAANLNRLLHATDYATVTARLTDRAELDLTAVCRTSEAGKEFEETLRGFFTLAAAGAVKQPDLAAALSSIQVHRDGTTVHAGLSAGADAARKLLRAF